MAIDKLTPYGGINISIEAIAAVAADAVLGCYGVVGLTKKEESLVDNINVLLKRENFTEGVEARRTRDGYVVDIYVILAYGVKITEIVAEVQKRVKYVLEQTFDIRFHAINVFIQGIRVM